MLSSFIQSSNWGSTSSFGPSAIESSELKLFKVSDFDKLSDLKESDDCEHANLVQCPSKSQQEDVKAMELKE